MARMAEMTGTVGGGTSNAARAPLIQAQFGCDGKRFSTAQLRGRQQDLFLHADVLE
jgi:hypothetical protein